MTRLLAGLLGMSLGIAALAGSAPALAQEYNPSTVVDLSDYDPPSGNGRNGVEVAQGDDGDTITYTIVENPDTAAAPPAAVYPEAPAPPDLSRIPVQPESGETTMAPPSSVPVSAPVTSGQPGGVVGDAAMSDPASDPASVPASDETATVATCADFPSWYDAQIYYESLGMTAAAPALVNSLDPDADGVACEESMQVS